MAPPNICNSLTLRPHRMRPAVAACLCLLAMGSQPSWAKSPLPPRVRFSHTADACTSCHQPTMGFSHPVGMVLASPLPDRLPLDADGRMTCLTCHQSRQSERGGSSHGSLRDGMSGPGLCAECHDSNSASRQSMHARSLGITHLLWDPSQSLPRRSTTRNRMPRASDTCLSCHDGSVASDIGHAGARRGTIAPDVLATSHPVDVPYRLTDRQSADGPLVPVAALDPRVHLSSGKVTCMSCHSPYAAEDAQLVMPNLGSRLCLSCHQY